MSDESTDGSAAGWLSCYVDGCDDEVTERLRLHFPASATNEVLACDKHAAILRMVSDAEPAKAP